MNPEIWIALISAASTGVVLKIVEAWLSRSKNKNEQDKQFRDELRGEAATLRAEIEEIKKELKATEQELDDWRTKYWTLFMEYKTFQIEVSGILIDNGINPKTMLRNKDG
jgi:hypothetical protein